MQKRSLIFAAIIAMTAFAFAAPAATMPASCNMPGMHHAGMKTAPLARVRPVEFRQEKFLVDFVHMVAPGGLGLSVKDSPSSGASGISCPHAQWAKDWRAWRARHPNVENANYRWDGPAPIKTITAAEGLNLSPTADENDPEPESPGWGGCGCPWDVAFSSDGCGLIHSTVYDIHLVGQQKDKSPRKLVVLVKANAARSVGKSQKVATLTATKNAYRGE